MKYLNEITDKLIFKNPEFGDHTEYQKRLTVKAIVKNEDGKIALITNDVHGLYLLPGGGADSDDLDKEVSRECEEEINYSVKNIKELARVKEFRNREAKEYETVCFLCDADGHFGEDTRTQDEKDNNLRVEWLEEPEVSRILNEQINKLEAGEVEFYNTAFNVYRDKAFWDEYLGSN